VTRRSYNDGVKFTGKRRNGKGGARKGERGRLKVSPSPSTGRGKRRNSYRAPR